MIQIGQAYLYAEVIRLRLQKFFQKSDGFRLAIALQMNFRQLQEKRTGFAHYALLNVQVSKLFEGANFFRSQLGDALVHRDCFGKETVANENLRKALEVVDGLERFSLADIELTDGHERDLIARLVLQNVLVFGDGLGDFALVQQLLCGLYVFAFVISHARTGTNLPVGVCL